MIAATTRLVRRHLAERPGARRPVGRRRLSLDDPRARRRRLRPGVTVEDSSSSLTLKVMLIVTVIFIPIVLAYTVFVYRTFWGRVKTDSPEY